MPELPEVEALAAYLARVAVGLRVARIDVSAISALKTFDPPPSALEGRRVTSTARHGKFLDLAFGADPSDDASGPELHLVMHLSRGGWLHWRDSMSDTPLRPTKSPIALRVSFVDDDGVPAGGFDLTEAGTQKRLAVHVVADPAQVPGIARLGPDPLAESFDIAALRQILTSVGSRQLKSVLKDQSVIAGIGNAYSDEVLHAARLSPFKPASKLTATQAQTLHEAIRELLGSAIERSAQSGAAQLKSEKKLAMRVHGRDGEPCPVCGDTVRSVSYADSSLQYCPTCQTDGKPLADRRMSRLLR